MFFWLIVVVSYPRDFPAKPNVLHRLGMSLEEHAIKHDTAFCDANLDPEEMSSQNAQYFSIRNCSKGCW